MKLLLLALLISFISGNDAYDEIIKEKVSEEYCNYVIGNMTALIKEGYIYLDYLKAPKQPKPGYFNKMDVIKELESIETSDRTFYDFYIDIQNVFRKTEDGHFAIFAQKTPKNIDLTDYYFCIPFQYYTGETYLSIEPLRNYCQNQYSKEILNKIKELEGKKIISINNLDPFEYLEEIGNNGIAAHSPQCKFI